MTQAVGFSCIPSSKDEDGLVALALNKKEVDVRNQQQQLVESLHKVLGGNPTLSVNVEGVKALPDDQSVSTNDSSTVPLKQIIIITNIIYNSRS